MVTKNSKGSQKKPSRDAKKAKGENKKQKFKTAYQRERDEAILQSKRSKRARKVAQETPRYY